MSLRKTARNVKIFRRYQQGDRPTAIARDFKIGHSRVYKIVFDVEMSTHVPEYVDVVQEMTV